MIPWYFPLVHAPSVFSASLTAKLTRPPCPETASRRFATATAGGAISHPPIRKSRPPPPPTRRRPPGPEATPEAAPVSPTHPRDLSLKTPTILTIGERRC